MNVKTKLAAFTTALTLGLTASQSFADNGYFGVPILYGDAQPTLEVAYQAYDEGYFAEAP